MSRSDRSGPIVVAGHCCLDVIPDLSTHPAGADDLIHPGTLIEVGSVTLAPGGAVSNVGLALHRLGVPTRLMGTIGEDLFGRALFEELRTIAPDPAKGMIREDSVSTSYTLVVSPPETDRIFFHHPGANDAFAPEDLDAASVDDARFFHFGYPPVMEQTYTDGGTGLARLFSRIRDRGVPVSLDMTQPDPDRPAGRVDWTAWLQEVLPHVDVFAPSFEELLYMMDRPVYERLRPKTDDGSLLQSAGPELLPQLSRRLHEMGTPLVAIKLGRHGLYLHTSDADNRYERMEERLVFDTEQWTGRQLLRACFQTETVGTTGAGDATGAGLLTGLVRGLPPAETLTRAVGVGAFSVEAADASSGVPSWTTVQERIQRGWDPLPVGLDLEAWDELESAVLWSGPDDAPTSKKEP